MAHHIDKRRKQGSSLWTNVDYAAVTETSGDEFDDPLGNSSVYAVQDAFTAGLDRVRSELNHASVENRRKRG